ncbi:conserved hypothetical protein [Deferribacter desulfuricans SSM1]|uniref:Polysaccharide chain length determinant N-terminal domain-containing protein n=1 Tax=Deferribacter desulfuricans (strain DSM 14783 / JCM 11476 / NBRC 101012 / SSM1) TaxID=639282 RepID=D3PBB9_DEFDS|nr:Wzz/FepE/Etk N-terminal domain-containing protein [Deferribacter desulfuricans]BAI79892.1 conserved hypothetical protein [Deferribacter desulfuricans SSM1]
MEEKNNQQIIPIQYVPIQPYEDDEIDLRDLIKTILRYKYFILIFTTLITLLAFIYVSIKKPIFQIEASLEMGYIKPVINNNNNKIYLLEPKATVELIKNKFDNSKSEDIKYPQVDVSIIKKANDILNVKIMDYSNKSANTYLEKIIKTLNDIEDTKINTYTKNIKEKISLLNKTQRELEQQIAELNKQLKSVKDAAIYQVLLNTINSYQNQIKNIKLNIIDLEYKLSPVNFTKTNILGRIYQKNNPYKPKKNLIIAVAFVTGLFLSIFLIFFIEFVKSFKEEPNSNNLTTS